jgi:16S rRNA (adenine1518-N6/adenine1519-N6)-dimethyltransferase
MIRERRWVDRAVLMFQREVAQRLTARPGSRDWGPLSVLASQAFEIEILFDLPPGAFRPRPRVVSSVTHWRRREAVPPLDEQEEARLRACLSVCFARRRQTLRNNLRAALRDDALVARALAEAALDPGGRAELADAASLRRLAAACGDALLSADRRGGI